MCDRIEMMKNTEGGIFHHLYFISHLYLETKFQVQTK